MKIVLTPKCRFVPVGDLIMVAKVYIIIETTK
jgi:hypothetical protein